MDGYSIASLNDMLESIGEDRVKPILSNFSCPLNKDVETFLTQKAIAFSRQGIAQTHLIFAQYKNNPELVAYFSLANKGFTVGDAFKMSKNMKRRINKFANYSNGIKAYTMSAPLIAQLGKNFSNELNTLITGDELLKMACDTVSEAQRILGGRFVYLECEEKEVLLDFYKSNGFVEFGKRKLDKDEKDDLCGEYLMQLLKYL